jgi:hypothetical protein
MFLFRHFVLRHADGEVRRRVDGFLGGIAAKILSVMQGHLFTPQLQKRIAAAARSTLSADQIATGRQVIELR